MPLFIDDGYTLAGTTSGRDDTGQAIPEVVYQYRPPLAAEMVGFRFAIRSAVSGDAVFAVQVKFLLSRLVAWDVVGKDRKPAPLEAATFDALPDRIFTELVDGCATWKPRTQEEAAGNSQRAQG